MAALKPVLEGRKAIKGAQQAVRDAATPEARRQALDDLRLAQTRLTDEQRGMIGQIDQLSAAWKDLVASVQPQVFRVATVAMDTLVSLMEVARPVIREVANVVYFAEAVEGFVTGQGHGLPADEGPASRRRRAAGNDAGGCAPAGRGRWG